MISVRNFLSTKNMRDAFIKTLEKKASKNKNIFFITGDLGYSVIENYQAKFPNQFLNVGIAEQNMTGIAAGLASTGKSVFTYSIANFPILRALEQIRNNICYHNVNVKIISMHTIKPLDINIIKNAIKETKAIFTIEEHSIIGGLGSAVAEVIAENNINTKFKRIGVDDTFSKYIGDQEFLKEKHGLSNKDIMKTIKKLM